MIRSSLSHRIKLAVKPDYRKNYREQIRLKALPRYVPTTTEFLGHEFHLVDAVTFLDGVYEIFERRVYEFSARTSEPLIVDCGANIGLSVIYFKVLYPQSKIIAYEADPAIFEVLKKNIQTFDFSDVILENKAVWRSDGKLSFMQEGGFSGRIAKEGDERTLIEVNTARLKDTLRQDVDFLKIDIEGAETAVIKDCADELRRVNWLFVEYHSHIKEDQNLHELLAVLYEAGFRYHIKEAYTAQFPFKERLAMMGMDLQLNIFAFRE